MKAFISTVPFAVKNQLPLEMLSQNSIEYVINPLGRKLTEDELASFMSDVDFLIAGTEPITEKVFDSANKLKLISRVGIGLDSVDLIQARRRNIAVAYTPDAPAPAVAELTIGLMLSLLRQIHISNSQMHLGEWHRFFGRRIADVTIGVIGLGRIGQRVLNRLHAFGTPKLLLNDIAPDKDIDRRFKVDWVDRETIYREADLISIHVPLTKSTHNMIAHEQLLMMKSDAMLINVSRGGIINEQDLYDVLIQGHLSGVALDVFDSEPYQGKLAEIERCLLTAHMGSMSIDCRTRMEIEATEAVISFSKGLDLKSEVPKTEYQIQEERL